MSDFTHNDFPKGVNPSVEMLEYLERFRLRENGGRRLGIERRQYDYLLYIPERRSGHDRRSTGDRRKTPRAGSRLTSFR